MSSSARGGEVESLRPRAFRTARLLVFLYPRKMKFNQECRLWLERRGVPGVAPSQRRARSLAGNPGKRALNKEEPVFTPIKGVAPPDWFSEDEGLPMAAVMWELTTKELCGQGLLCVTDLAVLERWCVAYEFWRRAVKNIARDGLSITGAMGEDKKP